MYRKYIEKATWMTKANPYGLNNYSVANDQKTLGIFSLENRIMRYKVNSSHLKSRIEKEEDSNCSLSPSLKRGRIRGIRQNYHKPSSNPKV